MFTFPEIDQCTSSSTTLNKAYFWYESCLYSHDSCKRLPMSSPGWLPSRVLDIGVDGHSEWKLRITLKDIVQSPSPPYMTLSYRWGSVTDILLLSSTLDDFRCGNPIEDLPQTFKDFVKVAWRFGIRYIWIDCLCIIQDSHNDWVTEAATMRYVYANSACNIAASAALCPQDGLFCTRDPQDIRPGIIETTLASDFPETYYIFDKSY